MPRTQAQMSCAREKGSAQVEHEMSERYLSKQLCTSALLDVCVALACPCPCPSLSPCLLLWHLGSLLIGLCQVGDSSCRPCFSSIKRLHGDDMCAAVGPWQTMHEQSAQDADDSRHDRLEARPAKVDRHSM
jgi:hypothetical protein